MAYLKKNGGESDLLGTLPTLSRKVVLNPLSTQNEALTEKVIALIYWLRFNNYTYEKIGAITSISRGIIYKIQHRDWFPKDDVMLMILNKLNEEVKNVKEN